MRRLLTPRWLAAHAAVLLMVAGFLALGWWQADRAVNGNMLSWAYTFEWPVFAVFVVVLWVREMRQALRADAPAQPQVPSQSTPARAPVITRRAMLDDDHGTAEDDPRLAEYNRYLAWLSEHPEEKP